MNNENIKEILVLQNYVNRYKSDEKAIINHSRLITPLMLDYLEVKNLLDYITNLQQELQNYKDLDIANQETIECQELEIVNKENRITDLQQENERLKEEKHRLLYNLEKVCEEDATTNN